MAEVFLFKLRSESVTAQKLLPAMACKQTVTFILVKARKQAAQILKDLSWHKINPQRLDQEFDVVQDYSEKQLINWILSASNVSVSVNPHFYKACCEELMHRTTGDLPRQL
jgi:hypothetical protein